MDTRFIGRKPRLVLAVVSILLLSVASLAVADIENIDVHGFASQGYMETTDYDYLTPSLKGSFAISEYAVNIGSDLSDELRVGVQLFARNLGELGNNEVGVDWAFGDYHKYHWLGVRAGRIKMPFGLYNETADFDHTRTSVLMPQGVYDLRLRELRNSINGVNMYGYLDLAAGGALEYSTSVGYLSQPRDGALAKFMNEMPMMTFGSSDNKHNINGQLIWNTPLDGLRLAHTYNYYKSDLTMNVDPAVAGMMGINPVQTFENHPVDINTSSAEFTYDNITVVGEYQTLVITLDGENEFDLETNWENWYAQGSYRLNRWFEFGTYYSVHYMDKDDRKGENFNPNFIGWQKDLALSARFDITNNMTFKLEGHQMNGIASLYFADNVQVFGDPSTLDENWYMFASKLSFVF